MGCRCAVHFCILIMLFDLYIHGLARPNHLTHIGCTCFHVSASVSFLVGGTNTTGRPVVDKRNVCFPAAPGT